MSATQTKLWTHDRFPQILAHSVDAKHGCKMYIHQDLTSWQLLLAKSEFQTARHRSKSSRAA